MASPQILITDNCDSMLIEGLHQMGFTVDYKPTILRADLFHCIDGYTGIIIATRILLDKKVLEQATTLKFIARAGSGMENIDTEFAKSKNIACINSPEGNANSVGEHAMGLLLSIFHNITKSSFETQQMKWLVEENRVHELEGKTIGIIGYGNTGKAFAKKLSVFGMNVFVYDRFLKNYSDRYGAEKTMAEIFQTAEIISLHVPLASDTEYLISLEYFDLFKKPIYIINTSRGRVINHSDLLQALKQGKVLGAALDVYENEKFETHSESERMIFEQLVHTGKVIFTPHIAGKSFESKKKISLVLLEKIAALSNSVKGLS
ncbi:MAG: hypothetical protein H0W62_09425 [Chitinophagales bacterium]|nr:hypothetical protein [Chitinophagales bacterium]